MKIAIDAMGGDYGLDVVIPAIALIREEKKYEDVCLVLVGDKEQISEKLSQHNIKLDSNLFVEHATEEVAMCEPPAQALRTKKDSSMRVAINLVKNKLADACVSAGNTGALVLTAKFVLNTLPGVDRAGIISPIPTEKGLVNILDLGANISCTSENLYQFAVLGNILTRNVNNIEHPKVALLNIGSESIKGTDTIKDAAEQIKADENINYVGFVEGNDIFKGNVDVIVCDGFTGNIALKSIEGLSKFFAKSLKSVFTTSFYGKFVGLLCYPLMKKFKKRLDPKEYNGATIIGLNGIVVKSHGGADVQSFANAIKHTIKAVETDVLNKLRKNFESQ